MWVVPQCVLQELIGADGGKRMANLACVGGCAYTRTWAVYDDERSLRVGRSTLSQPYPLGATLNTKSGEFPVSVLW